MPLATIPQMVTFPRYETSARTAACITRMLYDGDELTAEYNAAGTMLRRYVHGSYIGGRGVDDPPPRLRSGVLPETVPQTLFGRQNWYEGSAVSPATRRHILPNYQGSITTVTGSAGNGIAINRYDGVADTGLPAICIPASANVGRPASHNQPSSLCLWPGKLTFRIRP